MTQIQNEQSYFNYFGGEPLDIMTSGYLEHIFLFFLSCQVGTPGKVELRFTGKDGAGELSKDGAVFLSWMNLKDGYEKMKQINDDSRE